MLSGLSVRARVTLGIVLYLTVTILLLVAFPSEGKNEAFKPVDEFRLDPWVPIKIGPLDLSINKAVFYLIVSCMLTAAFMIWIARRMQARPNRVQAAVEMLYDLTYNTIARQNMSPELAARWFPFVGALFFFIWVSNLIGYLPLPINTHATVNVFGIEFPAFAIYAATANLSVPLVLAAVVWLSYHLEGVREKGLRAYLASWIPAGTPRAMRPMMFAIELISHSVRLISLSVRLFANMLAGHLMILFMAGGLAVLLGVAAIAWVTLPLAIFFFVFEVVLVATLQAFIFATLTSIYFGEATAEAH
ncbi:F0F1 ATP synthase subunit A [Thermoleophilum album]|uniref:ATP synthase subunit a n=1 Tax=Thermoleophilum album TaxID=29539 RepID=A0A1H6FJE0_THEAL|nr:F0F1 ATP synthase subunit A [Thermoleophilum album]SEH10320.1 F-type H+-transporting ATPase subunit a [Thermoleophilum album]